MSNEGFLRIANEADRAEVAKILFKNGYTVSTVRKKKNGKTYEYYIQYEIRSKDLIGEENEGQV